MKTNIFSLILLSSFLMSCTTQIPRLQSASFVEMRSSGNQLQAHQYSCGAASLATLMTIHGKSVTEKELLDEILPKKNQQLINNETIKIEPLSIKDLETLSKSRGFKVVSLSAPDEKTSIEALTKLYPVITRIKLYDDILHFVVVRSVNNGWVHIGDPGFGNTRVTWDQFYGVFEEAGRIFIAISKTPFKAKINEKDGLLSLNRAETMKVEELADEQANHLVKSAKNNIRFINSL